MTLEERYLNWVLAGVFLAARGDLNAHSPKPLIYSKMGVKRGSLEEKNIPKGLKLLRRQGLIAEHPTSGETTYQLTKAGRERVLSEFKKNHSKLGEKIRRHTINKL